MKNNKTLTILFIAVAITMIPFASQAAKAKVYGTGQAVNHPDGSKQICPDDSRKVCAKIPVEIQLGEAYEVEMLDDNEEVIEVQILVVDNILGVPDAEGDYNGNQLFWTEPEE